MTLEICRLVMLAMASSLYINSGCGQSGGDDDDDDSSSEVTPTPKLLVSGHVVTADAELQVPAHGAVYMLWAMGNGEDAYVFGRGESTNDTFEVGLVDDPPTEARLDSNGATVGGPWLFVAGTEIPEGPLSSDDLDELYETSFLGSCWYHTIFWFPTVESIEAFGLDPNEYQIGFNCAQVDSSGPAVEYLPVGCDELQIYLGDR